MVALTEESESNADGFSVGEASANMLLFLVHYWKECHTLDHYMQHADQSYLLRKSHLAHCLYRSILCANHGLIHFSSLLHGLAGRNVGLEAVPVACSLEKLVSIKGHSISMKLYGLS
jgi:hypothetical protein